MSNKKRKIPRPNLSGLPAVPLSAALLVVVTLVALGVTRPWQHQKVAAVTPSATAATHTPTASPTATTTSTATPTATASPTATPTPTPIIYVVQSGDTLLSIAIEYDTTVEALLQANDLDERQMIYAGQELIIPPRGSVDGSTPAPNTPTASSRETDVVIHVVQPGESLFGIALQYDTSMEVIMAANDITDAQWIYAGQELIIPLGTPTPVPTPTPRPTPTSTPGPPYAAPDLLDPAEGEVFRGEEADIVLNWASVGILAADEWYILRLRLMSTPVYQHPSVWTKVTSWRVPASLHPPMEAESHLFRWDVTVVRHTGTRPDGKPDGIAISPMSTTRSFFWY